MKLTLVGQERLIAENDQEVFLALKNHVYEQGEYFLLELSEDELYVWVQMDDALEPSLIYVPEGEWRYDVVLDESLRRAYSPKIFTGARHYIRAWLPTEQEIYCYRNLARNAHDQKEFQKAYPHVSANVETRDDSTFFARNAIDGMLSNDDHGSFPYQSWGINQQPDAVLTLDFGRFVTIDKIALVFRADYPHDSYWTNVTIEFDSTDSIQLTTTNSTNRQFFNIPSRTVKLLVLKELVKHKDESPFPALTELEVYGTNIKK